jgi:hypothetical protein
MPSRRKNLTGAAIERRIKAGRGRGEGRDYVPWLYTTDVPSKGTSVQWYSPKLQRMHHVLSQGEYHYLLLLTHASQVVDIREQFPLDLADTQAIAESLGYRHPTERGKINVMTTDFLLTIAHGHDTRLVARTCKPHSDLCGKRLFEKFEIERQYWAARGVDWGIVVTDRDVPGDAWRNIEWILEVWDIEHLEPMTHPEITQVADFLVYAVKKVKVPTLSRLCSQCDERLNQPPGTGLRMARFLFAKRVFLADLNVEISPDKPVSVTVQPERLKGIFNGTTTSHD